MRPILEASGEQLGVGTFYIAGPVGLRGQSQTGPGSLRWAQVLKEGCL